MPTLNDDIALWIGGDEGDDGEKNENDSEVDTSLAGRHGEGDEHDEIARKENAPEGGMPR